MRTAAPPPRPRAIAADVVQCARCGHAMPIDAWRALPRVRTLTHADVGAYVNAWPEGAVVEVRSCVGCGASLARRARSG